MAHGTHPDPARVEATTAILLDAARERGMPISGDLRIREDDLADLLGITLGYLRQLRSEGKGPPAYLVPLAGGRVTYRLPEAAAWIESRREVT
jgi:hypothetical protein